VGSKEKYGDQADIWEIGHVHTTPSNNRKSLSDGLNLVLG